MIQYSAQCTSSTNVVFDGVQTPVNGQLLPQLRLCPSEDRAGSAAPLLCQPCSKAGAPGARAVGESSSLLSAPETCLCSETHYAAILRFSSFPESTETSKPNIPAWEAYLMFCCIFFPMLNFAFLFIQQILEGNVDTLTPPNLETLLRNCNSLLIIINLW